MPLSAGSPAVHSPDMKTYEIQTQTRAAQPTAVANTTLTVDEIGPWLAKTYSAVARSLAAQGTSPSGPPFARYHKLDDGRFDVEAGFPVATPAKADGDVRPSSLPDGLAATTVHVGSYDEMEPGYKALADWVEGHGQELAGDPWEVYLSDPSAQLDPETWRTEIVQPYRPA